MCDRGDPLHSCRRNVAPFFKPAPFRGRMPTAQTRYKPDRHFTEQIGDMVYTPSGSRSQDNEPVFTDATSSRGPEPARTAIYATLRLPFLRKRSNMQPGGCLICLTV